MKVINLLFLIIVFSIQIIAQEYPEITIRDIQFATDSSLNYYGSLNSEPKSAYEGDTVTVTGVVMHPTYEGVNPDSIETLHSGAPAIYLQDENNPEWGGILVRDPEASTAFSILDTGLVISVTGVVGEYFTTTQLNIFGFEASNIVGQTTRPKPVLLTLDSLVQIGSGLPKYTAEKWEGVYVEFRNLTTTDPGIIGYNTFNVFDENGSTIVVGNVSDLFRRTPAPLAGTKVDYIRGYIETRTNIQNGWFMINPVYENDIQYGDVSPPNITNVLRDKGVVGFAEDVTVSARVVDPDATADVKNVKLFYSVNEAPFDSLDMTLSNVEDSIYSATIPSQNDSSLIKYYVSATDNDNATSTNPSNSNNSYFYLVLNRPLTIQDVQYSPFGSGFSGYNGYEVTVSGIVTADTTDIQGDGFNIGPQVYLQNGTTPWSGIQIFGIEADDVRRGDKLTATGIVNESFGVTRIGTLDMGVQLSQNGTGLEIPLPLIISTSEVNSLTGGTLPAESYEGVLVKIENVTVLDANADGNVDGPDEGSGGSRNYGEIYITDESNVQMRLELQDGTHDFHNFWDASLENIGTRIETGHTFESITGILFYSFSNYKLVPRKNDDFVGHVTDVENSNIIPEEYSLSQNYPNPFNPTTTISFSIPNIASSFNSNVTLKIYDLLGREVNTLVNEVKQPGSYQVQFDASELSSGIYFYALSAGNFYQTKKLVLLK
jgi:hypothetical protein